MYILIAPSVSTCFYHLAKESSFWPINRCANLLGDQNAEQNSIEVAISPLPASQAVFAHRYNYN